MKNRGLKNRFDKEELESAWSGHYYCLWCGKSGADCFHHIISRSSGERYIAGDHNSSVLNSFPIHNHKCHLYNSQLHKPENEKKFLTKVATILQNNGYELKKKDLDFLEVYSKMYD